MRRVWMGFIGAALAVCGAFAQVPEQTFPSRMVRIIVPLSAGSVTDMLARTIADKLAEAWHQQVIVDNRPGIAGTGSAAKSPADGYTVLLTSNGHSIIGSINKNLSFDPVRDFAGVMQVATVPFVLIASPAVPATTLKELIDLARANPGKLNIASPGLGTAVFIASELFKQEAKIDVVNIPYKGAPEAHTSVMRGDAQMFFSAINIGAELIHTGKVRPIAVLANSRISAIPDVPTFAEAGLPNFSYDAWFGIMVPAGTPRAIIDKLNHDIAAVLRLPDVRRALERQGVEPRIDSPDQFTAMIRADTERYTRLLKEAGFSAN